MAEYRNPEEERATEEHNSYVEKVLDQAVKDGSSLVVAMRLGEPEEVVERWTNALWDGLRDNLRDDRRPIAGILREDRLAAIVVLLTDRMHEEADKVLRSVRAAGDAS
jgi:hypothetical protein